MVCSSICVCIIHKSIGSKAGKLWTFWNGGSVVEMPLNNIHMTFKMRTFRNLNKIINHATHPLHINCCCCCCYCRSGCCYFAQFFCSHHQSIPFICRVYLSRANFIWLKWMNKKNAFKASQNDLISLCQAYPLHTLNIACGFHVCVFISFPLLFKINKFITNLWYGLRILYFRNKQQKNASNKAQRAYRPEKAKKKWIQFIKWKLIDSLWLSIKRATDFCETESFFFS